MLNCNDNIIVMGIEQNKHKFNDFEADMKDIEDEKIKKMKEKLNLITQQQKIEYNYQRIMNNNEMDNFYKVSNLEEKDCDNE